MEINSSAYAVSQEQLNDMSQTGWGSAAFGGKTDKEASIAQMMYANQFSAEEARKARQFSAQEALLARLFLEKEAAITREFNSAEAQKNRDYQTLMSNSQYKRAMKDMRNAGLNPALMYARGGMSAGTPTGAVASSSSAGTVAANTGQSPQGKLPQAIQNNAGALAMLFGSLVASGVTAGGKVAAAVMAAKKTKLPASLAWLKEYQ